MAICEICYNTGKIEGVGYCGCGHGKARKAEVEQKTKPRKVVVTKKEQTGEVNVTVYESEIEKQIIDSFELKEGDWVEFPLRTGNSQKPILSAKGYITTVWDRHYCVQTTNLTTFGYVNHKIDVSKAVVKKLETDVSSVDTNVLIDLALQTKDEEWFKQLTRGMAK